MSGDISTQGDKILIKNNKAVFLYHVSGGQTIQAALQQTPDKLFYNVEKDGESICWDQDGTGFYTIGEAKNPKIWYYMYKETQDETSNASWNLKICGNLILSVVISCCVIMHSII